jgi:hypothetical protein
LVAPLSALLCFFNFAVADPLLAQERAEEKNAALMDSKILAWNFPWDQGDGSASGGCSNSTGYSGGMQVRLSTCDGRIDWGESAALRWTCINAQTCKLTPDVGELDPNGSGIVNVSPKKTTRYTLIGTRPGSYARASVIITVVNIPPTISIIQPPDGSTLPLEMFDNVPIEIEYSDDVGIDTGSFGARINNQDITDLFTVTDTGASCVLTKRLPVGSNTLSVTISDVEGLSSTATSHFTNPDSDGDGMPDGWEVQHGLDPSVDDAGADPDGDELSNLDEYQADTDPQNSDTDGDGMPDGWEVQHGLDPLVDDAGVDSDGDGLSNLDEYQNGTDPLDDDTDGDGMPDGWEVQYGLDPLVDDAQEDLDGDGFSNIVEYNMGTEPNNAASKPEVYQFSYDNNGNLLQMQQP